MHAFVLNIVLCEFCLQFLVSVLSCCMAYPSHPKRTHVRPPLCAQDVDGMKQNMGAMRRELDAVVDQMFKPTQHQAQSSRGRYAASSGPRKSNAFV
jgi:hypothetical protein